MGDGGGDVRVASTPQSVFIAHPFTGDAKRIVETIILPTLRRHSLSSVICPADTGPDVVSSVLSRIRACDALIGVTMGSNANVFFEIGTAMALGKPCILLSASADDTAMLRDSVPVVRLKLTADAAEDLSRLIGNWKSR